MISQHPKVIFSLSSLTTFAQFLLPFAFCPFLLKKTPAKQPGILLVLYVTRSCFIIFFLNQTKDSWNSVSLTSWGSLSLCSHSQGLPAPWLQGRWQPWWPVVCWGSHEPESGLSLHWLPLHESQSDNWEEEGEEGWQQPDPEEWPYWDLLPRAGLWGRGGGGDHKGAEIALFDSHCKNRIYLAKISLKEAFSSWIFHLGVYLDYIIKTNHNLLYRITLALLEQIQMSMKGTTVTPIQAGKQNHLLFALKIQVNAQFPNWRSFCSWLYPSIMYSTLCPG